ncbi:ornithine cyclodeaminase family protein [Oceanicaulis sp.]|uniref:ornithine cyclodeaminase family protein n=1 Tax=Oceanicaulis sp. TaxID=1924941 RepID=UPI003F70E248
MRVIGQDFVRTHLSYEEAIHLMREGMIALSSGQSIQPLRSILRMADSRMFGVMPGALNGSGAFGAKLVSVFPGNADKGRQSHQGGILMFDPDTGEPTALVHAGEVTSIRTGAASAAATNAMARHDAERLTVVGYGEQAASHILAISKVRDLKEIRVTGRSMEKAERFARDISAYSGLDIQACEDIRSAVERADIIATVTASPTPLVKGEWLSPGAHINIVGSSYAGPAEVDDDLVARSYFIADHREGVLAQGAEFLNAKAAGRVDDSHVAGEIGDVYLGRLSGRPESDTITAYKSLGHIVQDLVCGRFLEQQAQKLGLPAHPF